LDLNLTPRRGGGIKDRTPNKLRQGYVGQGRQAVELGKRSHAKTARRGGGLKISRQDAKTQRFQIWGRKTNQAA